MCSCLGKMLYTIQFIRVGVPWFGIKKSNVQCDNVNAEMGKTRYCYVILN
jgi:hypothetical protein